jgi:hypothetical protein
MSDIPNKLNKKHLAFIDDGVLDINISWEVIDGSPKITVNMNKDYKLFTRKQLMECLDYFVNKNVELFYKQKEQGGKLKSYSDYIIATTFKGLINKFIEAYEISRTDIQDKDLYLLYSPKLNLYKIGVSVNVEQRINSIKSEMKINDITPLCIIHKMGYLEKELHNRFKEHNRIIVGKNNAKYVEWFEPAEEIKQFFEDFYETKQK